MIILAVTSNEADRVIPNIRASVVLASSPIQGGWERFIVLMLAFHDIRKVDLISNQILQSADPIIFQLQGNPPTTILLISEKNHNTSTYLHWE